MRNDTFRIHPLSTCHPCEFAWHRLDFARSLILSGYGLMAETRGQGTSGAEVQRANSDQADREAPGGRREGRSLSGRRLGRFRCARRHQGTRALNRPVPPSAFSRKLLPCAPGRSRPGTFRCSSDTKSSFPRQEGFRACRTRRRHGASPRVTLGFRRIKPGNRGAFHDLRPGPGRGRPPCTARLWPAWPRRRPAPPRRRDSEREDVLPEVPVVEAFCQ